MAQERWTQAQAFAIFLRGASQNRNLKLRDIAAWIVTSVSGRPPQPPNSATAEERSPVGTCSLALDGRPGMTGRNRWRRGSGWRSVLGAREDQAGHGVPAQVKHGFEVRWQAVQDDPPALVIRPVTVACTEADKGPEPGQIAVLDSCQAEIDVPVPVSQPGKRGGHSRIGELVDITGDHQPGRTAGPGNLQSSVMGSGVAAPSPGGLCPANWRTWRGIRAARSKTFRVLAEAGLILLEVGDGALVHAGRCR
jgi:hypothetical protein